MRVAIIGSGVSGLTCAHLLHGDHDVTIFESSDRAGGHAHTRSVTLDGTTHQVDTGFIVYNERNYPIFTRLLADLAVETRPSEMSFSVSDEAAHLEWRGSSAASIFAQPSNLARPGFLRMLTDVVRFNREARRLLDGPIEADLSLAAFLERGRWSAEFLDWYLIPMGSSIWSADPRVFLRFPAAAFARFFDNHGLLGFGDRPQWRTIVGGSDRYVQKVLDPMRANLRLSTGVAKLVRRLDGVELVSERGEVDHFDHVVIATHSDEALRMLSDASDLEREVLSSIRYRPNVATLHTDATLLPRRSRARASWNWHQGADLAAPTLTYDLSRLQGLSTATPLCLTLNRPDAVDPATVIDTTVYWHPEFDAAAMRAQRRHHEISGRDGVSFAGAYWGYGFHEDGARSAVEVCQSLGVARVRDVV